MKRIVLSLLILIAGALTGQVRAEQVAFDGKTVLLGKHAELFVDSSGIMSFDDVKAKGRFEALHRETYNFSLSKHTFWFRFSVVNQSDNETMMLELDDPILDTTELFSVQDGTVKKDAIYLHDNFNQRRIKHENPVLLIKLPKGATGEYYLRINGDEQIIIPLILRSEIPFWESTTTNEVINGLHFGLLLVMILYNLFIYLTIWDRSYLYYVLYILFICLTQATITGFTFKYLWPELPAFNNKAIVLFPALSGLFAIGFFRSFLHIKQTANLIHKLLHVVAGLYMLAIVVRLIGDDRSSYRLIDFTGLVATVLGLIVSIKLSLQGYRPAKFFLLAWTIFLIGIIVFVLRNLNIIPYSIFSNYTMQAGTAIEVVLLSFALADKIKILQQEESASRERAMAALKENERIVREQNTILEGKVQERTVELTQTNEELNNTLTQLKDAQTQLIESEKLASLGQLTAGIAHEINNPINFVSANIKPLKRDIQDLLEVLSAYENVQDLTEIEKVQEKMKAIEKMKVELDVDYLKEELDLLLKGIEEGAHRTVEIVKGLKNFSRLDETDINTVNINEGIQSTLILLNNQIGDRINVTSNLGKLPEIECYPGKLNQVFMNIISNAIYAVTEKPLANGSKPSIWITTTKQDEQHVKVAIKDNGMGMTPEVKAKIFDPFFTTKDVGKGTGLGLSIVFKIIEAHNGTIDVITEPNQGTEFIITLPLSNN